MVNHCRPRRPVAIPPDAARRTSAGRPSPRSSVFSAERIGCYNGRLSGTPLAARNIMPSTTADLLARDRASLIHSLHNRAAQDKAHIWVRGEAAVLIDDAGREFLDGLAGLWNVVVGHGRKELADAAGRQMCQLAYATAYAGSTSRPAIELAERLAALCYPGINRFYFTSGGAESNESAFKTARYYWKIAGHPDKYKVISRQWAYHGVTMAAMSATGIASYWPMFEPRVPGFSHIESPYPYRFAVAAGDGRTPGQQAADLLEEAILREGPETVAAFIGEPVQGAGGVIVPPDDYWPRIREICDRHQVLLIADEVITGFGRTGDWFGLSRYRIEPDIVTFAKGITSGYFPLGGMGVSDGIAAAIDGVPAAQTWMHAFTYSGHPTGCAVALANLDILEREGLRHRAAELGRRLLAGLRTLESNSHVGDVRGQGLMCAVELVADKATKAEYPPEQAIGPRVHAATQERGLFTRLRGDVYNLAPCFVTSEQQIDRMVGILGESIEAVLGK
jgi:putrescine aminotransferase